jgi:pimeloyl-ACP methyl ester carboxylesterase
VRLVVEGRHLRRHRRRSFDPALPLVVFLHGAALDHTVWALLARWFAHRGNAVLAPDLPGHGRSGGEPLVHRRHGRFYRGAD